MTGTETPSSTANVDRVAAEFAEAVNKNITHALTWVSNWYTKLANAALEDEVQLTFGKPLAKLSPDEKKAFGLFLQKRVLQASRFADSPSSSLGGNAMRAATLAAESHLAHLLIGASLTQEEDAAWDALKSNAPGVAQG